MTTTVEPPLVERRDETPEPTPETGRCQGRHRRTVVLSLVLFPVWAVLCTGVLDATLWWGEKGPLAVFAVLANPLGALVVLLVLLLMWCVTGRLWVSMGLLLGLTVGLAAINVAKMSYLTEPLFPSDYQFLRSTDFLVEMVEPGDLMAAAVATLLLVAGTVGASRVMGRRHPRVRRSEHPRGWATLLVIRLTGAALLLALLSSTLNFNEHGSRWRGLYEASGAVWQPSSQATNYRMNGFVGGALYNMPNGAMPMPEGYSEETMSGIAERYAAEAAGVNATRSPAAIADVNVVLLLSEAFADLARLDGVGASRDTMPLTRGTIADSWGGNALANVYGTGTSGMEFGALTGQSVGLFDARVTAPYQHFMTGLSSYPSAVGWFVEHGHRAIAVHPYRREFYRRDYIYPMLGFQDFVHDTDLDQDRLEGSDFISDRAAFDEVRSQIASREEPLLVNLVTMQNHVPTNDWYDEPVPVDVADGDQDVESALAGYARGQEYTDQALRSFLDDLRDSPEPTVVVFYGDHYPAVLDEELLARNPGLGHLRTPMFIWSSEGQSARELPTTSPATFLPLVFDLVGAERPPYYQLLSDVAEQIGAIGPGRIVTPDGREVTEADLTPEQQRLLEDYRLVQYDFSIGERYAVDEMWYSFG